MAAEHDNPQGKRLQHLWRRMDALEQQLNGLFTPDALTALQQMAPRIRELYDGVEAVAQRAEEEVGRMRACATQLDIQIQERMHNNEKLLATRTHLLEENTRERNEVGMENMRA